MPTTRPQKSPLVPSEEATTEQLQMAQRQGRVLEEALDHMMSEVVDDSQQVEAGPYLVAYAIEKAEGMWMPENGELVWHEPEEENIHLEVAVRDAADGRFIPGLTVHARFVDSQNNDAGMHEVPFIWHPWLYHYGRNWKVPKNGGYTLYVHIEAPTFHRHDPMNGNRYGQDVEVEFSPVKIQ